MRCPERPSPADAYTSAVSETAQGYFFLADFFFALRRRGTLPPSRRASASPIAIACLRLVTFLPLRPLFRVPRLRSCIARSTFLAALRPYFATTVLLSGWQT